MRTRRIPMRLAKALLALVSTFLTLGFAELAMRAVGWPSADPVWIESPETGFGFAANLNYRHIQPEFDVAFATNRLGLRDDEVDPKAGPRILLLGDSFACGYGVERQEMFADQLETQLGLEVVNAGVGGYETIHQVCYFQTRGRELKPDLVVYAMYLGNDLTGNRDWQLSNGQLSRCDGRLAINPPREWKLISLAKRSVWLRRAYHAAMPYFRGVDDSARPWRPDVGYLALCSPEPNERAQADLAEYRRQLMQLRDVVQASGARLLVVTLPTRVDVEKDARADWCALHPGGPDYDFSRPTKEVAAILKSLGIPHLALLEPLGADHARLEQGLYYPHDGHLNPLGHSRVAEHLAGWLSGFVDAH